MIKGGIYRDDRLKEITKEEANSFFEDNEYDVSIHTTISLLDRCDTYTIYDLETITHIKRYAYCMRMGVPPYSGTYEDQPNSWLSFLDIYDKCIGIYKEFIKATNGNG